MALRIRPLPTAQLLQRVRTAQEIQPEPPRPLIRALPAATAFPVDALGPILGPVAEAIHDRVRAPIAICGQSVLAAATLAVQAHANVELPTGQQKPLSEFFLTIGASGERKTAVDVEALRAVTIREAALRQQHVAEQLQYENEKDAWERARAAAMRRQTDRAAIQGALAAVGPPPTAPLDTLLTCPEPTYEGLLKYLAVGQPSVGIFTSEGGQFIGGHGMSDEAKVRTAAGLSALWDGQTIKRVRGGEGTT